MNIDRLRQRVDEICEEAIGPEQERERIERMEREEFARLEKLFACIPECHGRQFASSLKKWSLGGGLTCYGSSNKVFDRYIMDAVSHGWEPTPIPIGIIDAALEYPFLDLYNRCVSCRILLPSASGFVIDDERPGKFWQGQAFPFWPCPVCGGEPGNMLGGPVDWRTRWHHKLPPDPPYRFVTELPEPAKVVS